MKQRRILKKMKSHWQLYLFLVPTVLYFIIFRYVPMSGLLITFKDYNAFQGIWDSPWVGMKHIIRFFETPDFLMVIGNTLKISLLNLVAGFPIPIILALLLNQTRNLRFKKIVQTTIYAPHFISAVVIAGMVRLFTSPSSGIINTFIAAFGGEPIMFMANPGMFAPIYVISEIWQNMGYSSIIYIAALSGVSPELHESAIVDGATVFQRIKFIDIPSIIPTIVIILIMNAGQILTVGYEKIYLLQNTLNRSGSEVISTYVYKQAFGATGLPNFSYASAVGFSQSIVSLTLLLIVNYIAGKYSETRLV